VADARSGTPGTVTLFLGGDVMLGRGIDQILAHPGDPHLHEPAVSHAATYVELAEQVNGPIPRAVEPAYVWGDALDVLHEAAPDARIINLETSVTRSMDPFPKGIHYKMNPDNVACLQAAGIDCCVLANNHVLDWGRQGLLDTLDTLAAAGIRTAGAGRRADLARAPALLGTTGEGRVLVLAFGCATSGIPRTWAAGPERPGVNLLPDLSEGTALRVAAQVEGVKRPGDVVVASIHWGGNWGYHVPSEQQRFAHRLIERAGVDVVHGHSSHHPKAVEVYRERLVLYGCGDLLNDYEGIRGYEGYRGELTVMYLPALEAASGRLVDLRLVPLRVARFRLCRAPARDAAWLRDLLDRESARFGARVEADAGGGLALKWAGSP
jgi:poly-gamma-glutamate capsule biosynthesis protein CapA/YwtB (metallophosphatase superfamily)